uniref:KH domain-containing protein n=1 Tax=Bursaphelenchus xylophilus TaxID=6326 RepID=A0A1I7RIE9_BURXY
MLANLLAYNAMQYNFYCISAGDQHQLAALNSTPSSTSPTFGHDLLNGSGSSSSSVHTNGSANGALSAVNKPTPDVDYLTQLLKDKKQLAAFPNVFQHMERLLDDEINRVRVALFQCGFTREPLCLPEPEGEVTVRHEKVFVPVSKYPEYNFVGRILGPRGMTAKQLETETGCRIMVRGKGSMRDKKKEEQNKGKPNWEHLNEELHVLIQCEDTPNRIAAKMARAKEEVNKLLVPSPEGEDELKKKQLMELAILNGTFRNGNQNNLQLATALAAAANSTSAASVLRGSPALAGAPLIMQQATQQRNTLAANNNLLAQLQMQALGGQALLQQPTATAAQDYQQLLMGQYDQFALLQQQQQLAAMLNPAAVASLGDYKYDVSQHGAILNSGAQQRRFLGQTRADPYDTTPK